MTHHGVSQTLHFSEMLFMVVFGDKKVSWIPESYVASVNGSCGANVNGDGDGNRSGNDSDNRKLAAVMTVATVLRLFLAYVRSHIS